MDWLDAKNRSDSRVAVTTIVGLLKMAFAKNLLDELCFDTSEEGIDVESSFNVWNNSLVGLEVQFFTCETKILVSVSLIKPRSLSVPNYSLYFIL